MAARLNPKTAQYVRDKIKVTQLLNVINLAALGKDQPAGKNKKPITALQVDAAKYLINQAIGLPPQMTDINFTGQMELNDISDKPLTAEEWAAQADYLGSNTGAAEATH